MLLVFLVRRVRSHKVPSFPLVFGPGDTWSATTAEEAADSFLYISLYKDAPSFLSGADYAPSSNKTMNLTILNWGNDTEHLTHSKSVARISCTEIYDLLQR